MSNVSKEVPVSIGKLNRNEPVGGLSGRAAVTRRAETRRSVQRSRGKRTLACYTGKLNYRTTGDDYR